MSHDTTYPPLNVLKLVADGVWIVDSGPFKALGVPLPLRMTVVRLADGGLLLHSPTDYSADLHVALEKIGPVRHLVAPNIAHWSFMPDWQSHCRDVVTWGVPGLASRRPVRKSGLRLEKVLGAEAPPEWAGQIDQIMIPGAAGFHEVAFFHRHTRTLILTDIVQSLEAAKLPASIRPVAKLLGNLAPENRAPLYLRLVIQAKYRAASKAAKALVALAPDRVIFSHGAWFETDAAAALRKSMSWLL